MSPNEHSMRSLRVTLAILVIVSVAACSGKAPPTVAPSSGAATARPVAVATEPAAPPDDSALLVGRSGDDGLQLVLARSGERILSLPVGVPGRDWRQLVSTAVTGESTMIRDLRLPEMDSSFQKIDGAWRLPAIGLDPTPVGMSDDGGTVVLVDATTPAAATTARKVSRFAILDPTRAAAARVVELKGEFEYDALSPDGSILYVVEHLPGPPNGHYQVRALDTATGVLRDGPVADKNRATRPWRAGRSPRPGGRMAWSSPSTAAPSIHSSTP